MVNLSCNTLLSGLLIVLLSATLHSQAESGFDVDILRDTFGYNRNTPATIPLYELSQGCPERDCIRSIDNPKFVSQQEMAGIMQDNEILMMVNLNNEKRAYAIKQLNQSEIINDQVGNLPIAITYCPLCASGVVFERSIDGEAVEFGVSGLLHNSDLVFYDRKTLTLYGQISGKGLVGQRSGKSFNKLTSRMLTWTDLRVHHPDAKVSAIAPKDVWDTFSSTKYYEVYADESEPWFPVKKLNRALPLKAIVWGLTSRGQAYAVSDEYLQQNQEVKLEKGEKAITVQRNQDGSISAIDNNGKAIPVIRSYWFAWFNFHTETRLIK